MDATGRRTPSTGWLTELSALAPRAESAESGFVYYTQYDTGPRLPRRLGRALMPVGSFSILTLDGDNDTWSVTLFGQTGDAPLKALRDAAAFAAAWDEETEEHVTPCYRNQLAADRVRLAEMDALRTGAPVPLPTRRRAACSRPPPSTSTRSGGCWRPSCALPSRRRCCSGRR